MTPQQYLIQQAQAAGVDPLNLATVMHYESGINPTRWGGKGGNYLGLIQFGPNERQTYGVTPQSTIYQQTDAALRFLRDRGYRPGMGLLDLYSTVNAGSPGRYNASDGNGTVSSHVAAMGPHIAAARTWLGGAPTGAMPTTLGDAVAPQPSPLAGVDPKLLAAAIGQPTSFADALPAMEAAPAQRSVQNQAAAQEMAEKRRKQALFTQPIAALYGAG